MLLPFVFVHLVMFICLIGSSRMLSVWDSGGILIPGSFGHLLISPWTDAYAGLELFHHDHSYMQVVKFSC